VNNKYYSKDYILLYNFLYNDNIKAIETLYANDFDVQLRLSPFISDFINFITLANVKRDKILVEFLRVNSWVKLC